MSTDKIFDTHFHLLFKHFVTTQKDITQNFQVTGIAQLLDEVFGGPFDSQASPKQLSDSPVAVGIIAILAFEHAFANRILNILGINFSFILPLEKDMVNEIKEGKRTYYDEFNRQLDYYTSCLNILKQDPYNIRYLNRSDDSISSKSIDAIVAELTSGNQRNFAFSIEGGHNLSNVPIRSQTTSSNNPELQLAAIQNRNDVDIISLNLCHLSDIPEQRLGGFSQGVNKTSQVAFSSDDFFPKVDFGLSEKGKRVIRQALTHREKPILIDVKHMSAYTRFHYYRYRESLIAEDSTIERLPIISSHTGFTFISLADYVKNKNYRSETTDDGGAKACTIFPENRLIGKTNDKRNEDLFANPWTIGLFNEEIIEIMESDGVIGISMDQRVLGAAKNMKDGVRPKYYEQEYIAAPEWEKLFQQGLFPTAVEGLFEDIFNAPTRAERHIMLFCLHLIHAARLGYALIAWQEGKSPWDHLTVGSDFDGLINPLNGYDNVTDLKKLRGDLQKYLPIADKFLVTDDKKSLQYNDDGTVNAAFLAEVIEKVAFKNGVRFIARFLKNWS